MGPNYCSCGHHIAIKYSYSTSEADVPNCWESLSVASDMRSPYSQRRVSINNIARIVQNYCITTIHGKVQHEASRNHPCVSPRSCVVRALWLRPSPTERISRILLAKQIWCILLLHILHNQLKGDEFPVAHVIDHANDHWLNQFNSYLGTVLITSLVSNLKFPFLCPAYTTPKGCTLMCQSGSTFDFPLSRLSCLSFAQRKSTFEACHLGPFPLAHAERHQAADRVVALEALHSVRS